MQINFVLTAHQRAAPPLVSALGGDTLGLPQGAEQIAAGELGEVAIAPAAAHQFDEDERVIFNAVDAFREKIDAVEIAANADVIAPGDAGDMFNVIRDISDIDARARVGFAPGRNAGGDGGGIGWVQ